MLRSTVAVSVPIAYFIGEQFRIDPFNGWESFVTLLHFVLTDKVFKAHRFILAACSKKIQEIFEQTPSESIVMLGEDDTNMTQLMEYIYTGELHVPEEALHSFIKLAEKYQVRSPFLISLCYCTYDSYVDQRAIETTN